VEKFPIDTDGGRPSRVRAFREDLSDFRLDVRKRSTEHRLARVENNGPLGWQAFEIQTHGLAHPTLHSVAQDGFAHGAGHGEADTGSILRLRTPQAEGREEEAGVTVAFVIDFPKIAAAEDPAGFGKSESGRGDDDN